MTDKIALYVSIVSLIVFTVTACVVAWQGRKQARQHAVLPSASKAINLLRKAESDIRTTRVVNPIAVESMRAAKGLADLVINQPKVRGELDRLIEAAERLHRERTKGRDSALHQEPRGCLVRY